MQEAKEPSSTMLYVSNLPFSFESPDLRGVFSSFEVTSAYVATRRNGRSKGFGFVTFSTPDQQSKALAAVDGKELDGRTLTVKVAHKDDRRDQRGELRDEFKTETREPRKRQEPRNNGGGERAERAPRGDRAERGERKPREPVAAADKKPSETVVYVSNLPFEFSDADLSKVFAAHNPTSARIARRNNERSKGFGFVELASHKDQQAALALDGHTIGDRQISVKVSVTGERSDAGKGGGNRDAASNSNNSNNSNNRERRERKPREGGEAREARAPRAPRAAAPAASGPTELSETTVYVSNLPFELTDVQLADLFHAKGHKTVSAHIARKRDERSKGFGFVQFASHKDQQAALALDGQTLQERALSVKVAKKGSETRAADEKGGRAAGNGGGADANKEDGPKRKRNRKKPAAEGNGAAAAPAREKKASDTLVYVSNLSFDVDDNALAKLFDGLTIKSAHVAVRRNGRSKGFGFVELASHAEQVKALAKNGTELGGRTLAVEVAMQKETE